MLLLIATQAANVANTGFQMVMGRVLSPAEYSILLALLNVVLICSAPVQALRTVIAHYTARFIQSGQLPEVRALLRRWVLYILWMAAPVLGMLFFARYGLTAFLNLDRPQPVLVMGVVFVLSLFMTLLGGTLHGLQSFRWLVAASLSWSLVRLGCGAAFVLLVSATATAGLAAQFLATTVFVGVAAWAIGRALGSADGAAARLPSTMPYFWRSCAVLVSYAVLMYADLILVRRFLPEAAGRFAYAATIGRSVIFLPMPIAIALFPKVISEGTTTDTDRRMLRRGILYALCVIGSAVGACLWLPELALLILFGMRAPDAEQVLLVRAVVLAMSPLALGYILMNFELAQHRFAIVPGGLAIAAAYVAGVTLRHDTLWQVVSVLAVVSTAYLALTLWCLPRGHASGAASSPPMLDVEHSTSKEKTRFGF